MTKDDGRGRRGAGGSTARGEPVAGVLDDDERMHIEMQFGVPAEQVVRDHVIPTDGEWNAALGHQCLPEVGPEEAARAVREALERLR